MQAFLQRIINGGGRINREYALGRKRTDLLIEWPSDEAAGFNGEVKRVVIEIKIMTEKKSLDTVISEGIVQTKNYAKQMGTEEAYLVVFYRRAKLGWDEKIWQKTSTLCQCGDVSLLFAKNRTEHIANFRFGCSEYASSLYCELLIAAFWALSYVIMGHQRITLRCNGF
jgi:hypothetical protein